MSSLHLLLFPRMYYVHSHCCALDWHAAIWNDMLYVVVVEPMQQLAHGEKASNI